MGFIEYLLAKPFKLRVATRDCHPANHVSFASQHPGAEPFVTKHTIRNPEATAKTSKSRRSRSGPTTASKEHPAASSWKI
jgi:hypothetical protein